MKKVYSFLLLALMVFVSAGKSYAQPAYSVDPPQGRIASFPSEFVITFTEYNLIALSSWATEVVTVVTPSGDYFYPECKVVLNSGMNTNQLRVTVPDGSPIGLEGEYTVYVDCGKIQAPGLWGDFGSLVGMIRMYYDVVGEGQPEAKFTIDPAPGELTSFPAIFRVTFTDETSLGLMGGETPVATISGPGSFTSHPNAMVEGNVLTLSSLKMPLTPGTYKLTIACEELYNAIGDQLEYKNIEVEYEFNPAPFVPRTEVSPAPGSLRRMPSSIDVTFVDFNTVLPTPGMNPCVHITGPDGFDYMLFADNVAENFLPTNKITISIPQDLILPGNGEYRFTIPANSFTYSPSAPVKDVVLIYNLDEAPMAATTVTPPAGTYTELPSKVSFTFNDIAALKLKATANTYFSVAGPNSYLKTYTAEIDPSSPNTVFFNWTDGPTDPGAFTVILDVSGLEDASGNDPMDYADLKAVYILRVFDPVYYNVTVSPRSGVVSVLPEGITVSFDELDALSVPVGSQAARVNGPAGYSENLVISSNPTPDNELTIDWPNAPQIAGTYIVTLPVDVITDVTTGKKLDGEDIIIRYTLLADPVAPDYSVSPKEGPIVNFPKEVVFTFLDEKIVIAGEGVTPTAEISGPDGFTAIVGVTNRQLKNSVTADCGGVTIEKEGTYTVTLDPIQFVNEDGEPLNYTPVSVTYNVTISGIGEIIAEGCEADVYSVDGTVVLRKATSRDFETLPAGVYIVGGQKVLKK